MLLNLLVVLMLVLITFFLSLQGLFSALVLFVLSVISSVVAFGFYEDLYSAVLAQWLPGEGEAVALMAIFLGTLLALRLAVDLGIKGNVLLPARIDRLGGTVMGFLAGMVLTGMAMTAVQMLPFGRAVLGFSRHTGRVVRGVPETSGLFLGPDTFASGLAGLILDGSLSGKPDADSLGTNHPDLLSEYDARRSAGPLPDGVLGAKINVQQVWWPDRLGANSPDSGMKYLGARVKASGSPGFTAAQFRAAVYEGGRLRQFPPIGAGDGGTAPAEVELLAGYSMPKTLDLVFQVPAGVDKMWYVAYNGRAKGEVSESMMKDASSVPPTTSDGAAEPAKDAAKDAGKADAARQKNPGGRTHAADVADAPYVGDDLPGMMSIPTNEIGEMEVSGKRIVSGHLVIDASKVKLAIPATSITKFNTLNGQKLVQVPLQRVFAGSVLGQAINFADRTFQQSWSLKDELGKVYFPVGAFAQAKTGGGEFIEIQYYATQENIDAGHTLGSWRKIQESDFKQPDAKLIFLYLVPPGTHIVGFQTNRGGGSDIDLRVN